jgi:hypothetical protein
VVIRQLIREMLSEKTLADVAPSKPIPSDVETSFHSGGGLYYGDKPTTSWRRSIKRDWNEHADLAFFQDSSKVEIVHYLGYYSKKQEFSDYFPAPINMQINAALRAGLLSNEDESIEQFMTDPEFADEIISKLSPGSIKIPGIHVPNRNELSCFGYVLSKSSGHSPGYEPYFTFKKYRVTFVSNRDAATERLSNATPLDKQRMKGSGLAKRPHSSYERGHYPLDAESSRPFLEEVVIDNWIVDTYYGPKRHAALARSLGIKHEVI